MKITAKQLSRVAVHLPKQRGNVSHETLNVINAILYVAESGCKWRELPKRFGNWHTVYTRMNRWAKAGILDRLFAELERQHLIRLRTGTRPSTGYTAPTFKRMPRTRTSMAVAHGACTTAEQNPGKWLRS
jgi:transposase